VLSPDLKGSVINDIVCAVYPRRTDPRFAAWGSAGNRAPSGQVTWMPRIIHGYVTILSDVQALGISKSYNWSANIVLGPLPNSLSFSHYLVLRSTRLCTLH